MTLPFEFEYWSQRARALSHWEFVRRHPGFFLLTTTDAATDLAALSQSVLAALDVFWMVRSSPFGDRGWISVGRDSVCDIVLRDRSVSKVHAHFQRRGGELVVVDARSKNGTFVNEQPVVAPRPRPVAARDLLRFGSLQALLVTSDEAYGLLAGAGTTSRINH